jgi:hypothetical protein
VLHARVDGAAAKGQQILGDLKQMNGGEECLHE